MPPKAAVLPASKLDREPAWHNARSIVQAIARRPLVTRRRLQVALAVFWLLDGALQLQPFMFTRGFAEDVIAPAAIGQPALIASAVHWAASVILVNPPLLDAAFAGAQLAIGLALLFRRTARAGVVASIGWAIGVWVLGEGVGGLGGGTSTFVTGAPGAVLLYAVLGLAAWPRLDAESRSVLRSSAARARDRVRALFSSADDERPASWVPAAWALVWGLFALLRALPANDSSATLARQLRTHGPGAPGWLAAVDHSLSAAVGHDGLVTVIIAIAVELGIGFGAVWNGAPRRIAGVAGIGVALAVWVFGQAFGQIPTGMGTDPNSGPLVALLGIALLGRAGAPSRTIALVRAHQPVRPRSRAEAA